MEPHGICPSVSLVRTSIPLAGWFVRWENKDDQEQTYQLQKDGSLEFFLSWFSLETGFYEVVQECLELSTLPASVSQILGIFPTSPRSVGKMELPMSRTELSAYTVRTRKNPGYHSGLEEAGLWWWWQTHQQPRDGQRTNPAGGTGQGQSQRSYSWEERAWEPSQPSVWPPQLSFRRFLLKLRHNHDRILNTEPATTYDGVSSKPAQLWNSQLHGLAGSCSFQLGSAWFKSTLHKPRHIYQKEAARLKNCLHQTELWLVCGAAWL